MATQRTIFITGITGNQGSALAKYLLDQNFSVIGLTRDAKTDKAKQWKDKGATIVEGNLDDPETFRSHLNRADGAFLVQTLQGKEGEIVQGKRFLDAIDGDNDLHLVYSSVLGADLNTGVPHFESKFEIENYLKSLKLSYTIIRPASFYENHLFPRVASDIKKGKYVSPLKKTCRQQMIGTDDIGKIAATVFANKEKYRNRTLSIATDEWKIGEVPAAFAEAINRPVSYKKLPGFIARLFMGKDLSKMFRYMNENDFSVIDNIQEVRDEFKIEGNLRSWARENFG